MFAPKVAEPQAKAPDSPTRKLAPQPSTLGARPSGGGAVEQARMLQGMIGNQATLRYLTQRLSNLPTKGPAEQHEQEAAPENMTARETPRGLSWDFSKVPVFAPDRAYRPHPSSPLAATPLPGAIQAKLAVGQVDDPLEHEADHVADQVMRMSDPVASIATAAPEINRKCTACEDEQKLQKKEAGPQAASGEAPAIVHDVLRSPGQPLDAATGAYFEPRFGYDFSQVRIHTDSKAATSSRSIQALAYTCGRDIAFAAGQYSPQTESGKRLLAHELAHVVQQGEGRQVDRISRFSDTDHHVIEEAALELSKLSAGEIAQIHAGNVKRDYSQTGAVANLFLLCDANSYGGYKDTEHFEGFVWKEELQKWISRKDPDAFGRKNPVSYIDEELIKFVDALPDLAAFQHVGRAFHAIEDFFAHSNFVHLINGDYRFGNELVIGHGGSGDTSMLRILESVSSQETASFYGEQAGKETAKSPPQSHGRVSTDYKSNPYYAESVVLTALVIQEIGSDIRAIRDMTGTEERVKYVRDVIMTRLKRYLRPPSENDKWWETLRASGGKEMEKAVKERAAKTPVTKNQCILSPLRSIEASRDSNLKLLGPTFPIETKHGHVMIQLGTGFLAPPAFKGPSGAVEPRSFVFVPFGVQITGTVDWLK